MSDVLCPDCEEFYPFQDCYQGGTPVKPGTVLNHYCCPGCRYEWGEQDEEPQGDTDK